MPTTEQQIVLVWLLEVLRAATAPTALVLPAPLRLRLPSGRYREPDLLLVRDVTDPRVADEAWYGADLVVEIINPSGPERDLVEKPTDYAAAHIPEYWIVDPRGRTLTILSLTDGAYTTAGVYQPGQLAASVVLPGVTVDVAALFEAASRVRRPSSDQG